jgi:hypothetical protein
MRMQKLLIGWIGKRMPRAEMEMPPLGMEVDLMGKVEMLKMHLCHRRMKEEVAVRWGRTCAAVGAHEDIRWSL